jgi:hypothetical protein
MPSGNMKQNLITMDRQTDRQAVATIMNVNKLQPLLIFIVVSTAHLYNSQYLEICTVCYAVVVMKNYEYYEMLSVDILVVVAPMVAILGHFCNQDWKLQPCLNV